MKCPTCGVPMRDMPAPPASTIYVCDNTACPMDDVINPSVDPRS